MSRLKLSLACWNYDRVGGLADGSVRPDGIDLNVQTLEVEEIFFRMLRNKEFDVAEMSLSSYCVTLMKDKSDFIAIPVFPSRMFRHSSIYVSKASGIEKPQDLVGKRIGIPEFQMTAPTWIRGMLESEYGVPENSVSYLTGGQEEVGRDEKLKLTLPPDIRIAAIGSSQTLSRMLADGEIDALYTARAPSTFFSEPDKVGRLFQDFVAAEQDYFARTRIFPIMHVVAIRRDVYEANRWVAQALYKAFEQAKSRLYGELKLWASLKSMLPWQIAAVEEAASLMGEDWWPYGLDANRHVLETFLAYHHKAGLSRRLLRPEELFAPETHESFKV